ncbi:TPA: AMP-binding protein [Klebsiella pneumoniae]
MRTVQSEHDPFLRDFWREESARLYWETDFTEVVESLDGSPRCRWFTGGRTNLSFNALDRHLAEKGEKCAIIHRDYLGQTHRLSYRELWQQVNTLCSMMQSWGVKPGDRVLIALPMTPLVAGLRVVDTYSRAFEELLARHRGNVVPCTWLAASAPSHLLFTSGTTGTPKGIVRDTGGYAVALLASLVHLFRLRDDEIFFTTADAGWVTGHSYGIYGPLLAGLTTVLCEVNSPGEYWWQMVETLGITRMLTIAGAIRMARRQGKPRADLTSLRTLYLAGEPLDNATDEWVAAQLGVPCENHYWQTESGWPLLAGSGRALSPVFTRAAEVVHPASGKTCAPGETGMLVINNTLGPGGMSTLWQNDIQHDQYYWSYRQRQWRYATHDCAIRVGERIIIQGRMDDVMNIGGKRIATAEIENTLMGLEGVVEVVAAGTAHYLLGEMVALFVVTDIADPAQQAALKKNICARLVARCGRFAVPRRIHITSALPKTFSGKVMRRILVRSGKRLEPHLRTSRRSKRIGSVTLNDGCPAPSDGGCFRPISALRCTRRSGVTGRRAV